MTASRPKSASAVIRAHFREHRETFVAMTTVLAAEAARFDKADRLQRLPIMAGALHAAVLDNLRFWAELRMRLHGLHGDAADDLAPKIAALADFTTRQSKGLLSLNGDIAPLLSINHCFLGLSAAGSAAPDSMYISAYS